MDRSLGVAYCIRHSKLVIAAALLLAALSAIYTARHFAIDTDINNLISDRLPWRQNEIAFQKAFPQTVELILVDVAADTPEVAKDAARDVLQALAKRSDLFLSVRDQLDSSFFRRNGLLFLSPDQVAHVTEQLSNAAPLLSGLARDPSLRGLVQALVGILDYAKQGYVSFDDMARPLNLAAATLEGVAQGHPVEFSWRTLAGGDPRPLDLHRFVEVLLFSTKAHSNPVVGRRLPFAKSFRSLGFKKSTALKPVSTGPVIISDNEFAGVHQGATLNGAVTGAIVLIILGIALRSIGLVAAVVVTLAAGLLMTAAGGIFMVGALNPISLAFAVLFVGLGADFAIQYTVRYRAERHDFGKLDEALIGSAGWVGIPLSLAAGAAAAGFLSFTPTSYRGLAQLGIIAGFGMVVAYVLSLTLLPALIRVFNAPPEPKPLTLPALAPADAFLKRHRLWVVSITVLIVLAGLPALTRLQFNFDPLALENQSSPALRSILRLAKDLPLKTARLLVAPEQTSSIVAKLDALPEVAATWTIDSFVPADQDKKLEAIGKAKEALDPAVHATLRPSPSDAENVTALQQGVHALEGIASQQGAGAEAARRLANAMQKLSQADQAQRARATDAFIRPLQQDLNDIGQLLMAEPVTRQTLPADLVGDWVAEDGRKRIEVWPKGNANDNAMVVVLRGSAGGGTHRNGRVHWLLEWGAIDRLKRTSRPWCWP